MRNLDEDLLSGADDSEEDEEDEEDHEEHKISAGSRNMVFEDNGSDDEQK
jgi:hypothetical protein